MLTKTITNGVFNKKAKRQKSMCRLLRIKREEKRSEFDWEECWEWGSEKEKWTDSWRGEERRGEERRVGGVQAGWLADGLFHGATDWID